VKAKRASAGRDVDTAVGNGPTSLTPLMVREVRFLPNACHVLDDDGSVPLTQ
jgi:hypothetical protein